MDAFEQLVGEIFSAQGYWIQTSYKVELTKDEKKLIERSSSPRWELDLVAYRPSTNEILVIECKSYLDSTGVSASDLVPQAGATKSRYKLFVERNLREIVFNRLKLQLLESGLCKPSPTIKLGLACGRVYSSRNVDNRLELRKLGIENDWILYDENWLNLQLINMAQTSYQNSIASVVVKIMERGENLNKYAHIAVKAANKLQTKLIQPKNAWAQAARDIFPHNVEAREKSCPKTTFLGLCESGLVKGVSTGKYTNSIQNKAYAVKSYELLKATPALASDPKILWEETLSKLSEDVDKTYNQQMHVVAALFELNLLV